MICSSNWSDFLSTPPNLLGSTPDVVNDRMSSNFKSSVNQLNSHNGDIFSQTSTHSAYTNQNNMNYEINENRVILVSNADPSLTNEEVLEKFNYNNSIDKINTENIEKGEFTVEYFDIRNAIKAKKDFDGCLFKGRRIQITYAPLPVIHDTKKPPNNGTIVIFHLPPDISDEQMETIFGQFGEIREIRSTPTKPGQKFVEYWDTRHAEKALLKMAGRFVMGAKVSIEYSLPGGKRKH